jgi:alkanesulfonate monooxygenase SsuD/methylene tetrahydromethanopterin reductase-like flavin-dependent oxidoreductase (luciferase family)
VGTALTVAPLRHPLHLAEEAAMVDVISGGRLLLALGSGNYRPEYELFDVPFEQQSSRFDELLTVLLRGLRGERFDHDGTHWQLRGAAVRPRPVQQPHPPVWVGAMSPRGVRRAAEHGLPLLLDPLSTIERLEELVAHYREHWTDTSREPEVMLMRWGWVGPREQVEEIWWPHVRGALWSYIVDIPRVSHASVDIRAATPDELDLETVAGERLLVGEAEEVRELAAEWVARLGASRLIIKLQGASGPWGEDLHAGVEAYARTFEERE